MSTGEGWREAVPRAAVVNAVLVLLVLFAWLAYVHSTADVPRPGTSVLFASSAYGFRNLLFVFAISLVVGWRTYVHARGYCDGSMTRIWRGPLESAALGGGITLAFALARTGSSVTTQQPSVLLEFIGFYVIAMGIAGLLMGVILVGVASLVLRVNRAA